MNIMSIIIVPGMNMVALSRSIVYNCVVLDDMWLGTDGEGNQVSCYDGGWQM